MQLPREKLAYHTLGLSFLLDVNRPTDTKGVLNGEKTIG